jgi:hypothetical protein
VERSTVYRRIEPADELAANARTGHRDRVSPPAVEDLEVLLSGEATRWRKVCVHIRLQVLTPIVGRVPRDVWQIRLRVERIEQRTDLQIPFGLVFDTRGRRDVTSTCDHDRDQTEEEVFSLENHDGGE